MASDVRRSRRPGVPTLVRRGLTLVLVLWLGIVAVGWSGHAADPAGGEARPDASLSEPVSPPTTTATRCAEPAPESPPTPLTAPLRLEIPAIDVDTRVTAIELGAEGQLVPPSDFTIAGWWSSSALPGSDHGTVLVTGHTVSTGGGVFDDLADLRPGDSVRVRTSGGEWAYRVTTVKDYTKDQFAARSAQLCAQDGDARLVLVTCSHYDHGRYRGNTVVVAEPVRTTTAE